MLQTAPSSGIPARRPSLDDLASFMGDDDLPVIAAGTILRAPDGSVLFLKRSDSEENYAGHWGLPGGGTDDGEAPEEAARRECLEETGHAIAGELALIDQVVTGTGKGKFATYEASVASRFRPKFKDGEHTDFVWAQPDQAPRPLHPALAQLLGDKYGRSSGATDSVMRLALDRESVRNKIEDDQGELWRLEVGKTNLSKATVNPYLGREIPNAAELGLDPDKVYQLLRHPDELKKAAPSANMVPLLRKHRPVSADDHQPYDVVGATGSSANFDGTYLTNALSIWTREGVEAVESGRQKELSCGYAYRAEMTPGNFDGTEFDGVMRDLRFNHVALVEDGRAGPDVVVGDSNQEIEMAENRDLAKRMQAISTRQVSIGALLTYLKPRMALDAKAPIMAAVFDGVTGKNFKEQKPVIAKRLRDAATGKLIKTKMGQDTSLDDVEKVLDMLSEHEVEGGDESVSKEQHNAMEAAAHGNSEIGIPEKVGKEFAEKDTGKSFDAEAVGNFLREKGMGEDDVSTALGMMGPGKAAEDEKDPTAGEEEDEKEESKKKGGSEAGLKKAEDKKAEDKKAMDAQIKLAVDAASKAIREGLMKTQQQIRAAEAEVRPYVGELPVTMSFDSAAAIKRHALGILKVPGADTVHEDALSAILAAQPKPGTQRLQEEQRQSLGMDAASTESFHKRFPGSERIRAA